MDRRLSEHKSGQILRLGQSCWRIARSDRATVLVDAAEYFSRLEAAFREARHSILILGWDFDGSIRLRPDADPEASPALAALLRAMVEARPGLEVHILVWSIAVIHAPSSLTPLLFGRRWQNHPRIHLKLDTQHPIYGAHHQKIVVVDDSLAFVGGIDLTLQRWDTPLHCPEEVARMSPNGGYRPVHDVQMMVDGDAAQSLADLARHRWHVATGELLSPVCNYSDHWPEDLKPEFTGTSVGIARTMPAWRGRKPIHETARLTARALEAARHSIYIEAQYFTATYIRDVLEARLSEPNGPEVVIITTRQSLGIVERFMMGSNRDRLIRHLRRRDPYDRLRVYFPYIVDTSGKTHEVLIHSKLLVVDDVFLRVGSSNLNNRSVGVDTECDLAVEASTDEEHRAISGVRDRLLAEHLDVDPDEFSEMAMAERSLVRAIDALNQSHRGLRLFSAMWGDGPVGPAPGTWLLDPERTFGFLRRRRNRKGR